VKGPRTRFAPSPTGSLHLGNARTALFNWLVARAGGGTSILRIEDTDTVREQEGSEAAILQDLRWLGLDWDEGPDAGGAFAPYRQSERGPIYADAARRMLVGGQAFRCFCTASGDTVERDAAHHQAGAAAGHRDPCRALALDEAASREAEGELPAIRFRVPSRDAAGQAAVRFHDRLHGDVSVPLAQVPDAVLLRADGRPTYNFAVVVDDAAMQIDLVLRGDDHLSNTPLQVLLYNALGAAVPEFAHVPMVLGPDGERLSKRHGATSVAAWRERGVPPEALINALALMGWAPENDKTIVSLAEIAREFDLNRVGRSAAIFDAVKLDWISSQHIHGMPAERLSQEVGAALVGSGCLTRDAAASAKDWIASVAEFLRSSLSRFDQAAEQAAPIFHPGGPLGEEEAALLCSPGSDAVLAALASALREVPLSWAAIRKSVEGATGAKGKALFQPIRIALTGRAHGRELDRLVPLIDDGQRALPEVVPSLPARLTRTLDSSR
jgi:glutamyl-tRNA synthetase/nondiscriminating glutamyl-tRNA synthetase